MKKIIIGSLVGAILVFGWQAVAHMFMHHHDGGYKQAPNDAAILSTLSSNIKEEGQYYTPAMNLNASAEEMQKQVDNMKGKPWAIITYHPSYEDNMGMAALRSFVTAFICVVLFIWLLGKNPGSTSTIFFKGLGIAAFTFLLVWYNQNIWMQTPWDVIKGELIDLLVAWGLCGLWLGWWLNKQPKLAKGSYMPMN